MAGPAELKAPNPLLATAEPKGAEGCPKTGGVLVSPKTGLVAGCPSAGGLPNAEEDCWLNPDGVWPKVAGWPNTDPEVPKAEL